MKYHTIWSQSKCSGPIILFYFGILTLGTTPLTVTHKYRRSFFLDGLEKKPENVTVNILIVKYETLVHINFLLKR